MKFTDYASLAGTRRTADGYLVAEAFAVRTGIQLYAGAEVGLVDRDVVRVYRPESEVRAPESLRTFSHAPVTMGHPSEPVTTENWKDLAIGEVSTEAEWHDGKIRLPLILKDAAAISAVAGGTRELSAGYTCRLEIGDGVSPDGEPYDAVQRDIRINHLAVVSRGRAGEQFRIGDEAGKWGVAPITTSKKEDRMSDALKTVVLGDKAVQVATTDVAAVEAFKADAAKALVDAEAKHAKEIAAKDTEIAKKDAQIVDLKGKILDDAALDARVASRADLIGKAKAIAPSVKVEGVSDAAIRKAVVVAKHGAEMADKSDAYIDARFDILAESIGKDPVRGALGNRQMTTSDEASAYAEYLQSFNPAQKEAN
ncbi:MULTISPECIES: DUF2213 domain-containing protein [unclassified Haematobacter]|uniref:DUF2213 domain-containing protein n=1 Tax=unclassified Haematobacter TaxID=2640585 RepID=UPI0025BC2674|nr:MULTISPECIES: DUF2213 domain-containing protein [unclassified Haematobacter]